MKNILICGAGRSGTSMLAGLFSNCGYFQGGDLYPAREANPKGFFENWQINTLNERIILSSLEAKYGPDACGLFRTFYRQGQYWLARLPMDFHCVATADDKKEILDLVAREPFCYKDPRFCYTLEPWLDVAPNAVALCVFRHPGVVVASILKEIQSADYLRDLRISVADLYETWRHMYLRMLAMRARGSEVYFVSYNDLFKKSKLTEIEKWVGAKVNRLFPDKLLDRSDYEGDLDGTTKVLFDALSGLASKHFADQSEKSSSAICKQFSTLSSSYHIPVDVPRSVAHKVDKPPAKKGTGQGVVFSESELQGLVYRLYEQKKDLEAGIKHKEGELDKAHVRLAQGDEQNSLLRADIGLQGARLADLEAKQKQLMEEYSVLQTVITEQRTAIVTFETALAQRAKEIEGLWNEIGIRDARIGEVESALEQRAKEIEGLWNEIGIRDTHIGELESILIQRDQSIAMLSKEIDQRNYEIATLKKSSSWRITAPLRAIKRWWLRIVRF